MAYIISDSTDSTDSTDLQTQQGDCDELPELQRMEQELSYLYLQCRFTNIQGRLNAISFSSGSRRLDADSTQLSEASTSC